MRTTQSQAVNDCCALCLSAATDVSQQETTICGLQPFLSIMNQLQDDNIVMPVVLIVKDDAHNLLW